MKRLIALLLVLLMLAGCGIQKPEPTTVPTTEPTTEPIVEPTQPAETGLYVKDSFLEQMTSGAVKAYAVDENCEAVYPMGENLLLFMTGNTTTVGLYGGDALYSRVESVRLNATALPGDPGVQITEKGLNYFDDTQKQIVLLDANLTEVKRVTVPDDMQGVPVVDPEFQKAYFCTENEVRVMDLSNGIASLLRQESVAWQSVRDVCFDGDVLLCDMIDQEQNAYLAYIDTENGRLLGKEEGGWDVDTYGDVFLLYHAGMEGAAALFGTWTGEVVSFVPAGENAAVWSLLPLGGAAAVSATSDNVVVDFYTLETGLRTASVALPAGNTVYGFVADANNRCVWFLMEDGSGSKTLCRWDVHASSVTDETVYLLPQYTESAPDREGLEQCRTEAQLLGAANGMEIAIWNDAIAAPWDGMKSDYRVSSFRGTLEMMEQVLAAFPEGMTAELASLSRNGVTSVSIVLGEADVPQSYFAWVEGSIYIAIETGEDGAGAFCDALYRAMDTYILNRNSQLDEWDSDTPVDDRAMIFRYAMAEDMEAYFAETGAQSKLEQLCEAIRDAFGLEEYEEQLLWEQYLDN